MKLYLADLPFFVLFLIISFILFSEYNRFWSKGQKKATLFKAVTKIRSSSSLIAHYITDVRARKSYDSMHVNLTHAADETQDGGGAFICIENYRPPPFISSNETLESAEKPTIFMKYKCLHFSDEKSTHFILKKGEKWDECFIIIPLGDNHNECLIYFYSEFGTKPNHIKTQNLEEEMIEYIREERFEFLNDLKNYCSKRFE